MFRVFILIIIPLSYYYIGKRLIEPAKLSPRKKALAWAAVIGFLLLVFSARYLRRQTLAEPLTDVILNLAYISLGFSVLLFTCLFIRDIILLVSRSVGRLRTRISSNKSEPPGPGAPHDPERRRFIINTTNLGLLALSGGLAGYGVYQAVMPPRIKRVEVPLANLPDDLEGLVIVQITDLHVGPTVKRDYVETVVRRVMDQKPDLIVLTGDIVEGPLRRIKEETAPLGDLKAPMGKYFVTGNHEYYHGVYDWDSEMERIGFDVLTNEHRVVTRGAGRLLVAGVPDPRANWYDPGRAPDHEAVLKNAPESQVKIMLAHRPHAVFKTARHGFDLQLSGHTHGGQIFPGQFLVRLREPFVSGLHLVDRTWIYVSRGTGFWGPPMRVGAPGEITDIRLKKIA